MYNVSSQKAARSLTSRWSSSSTVTYSVACVSQSTDTHFHRHAKAQILMLRLQDTHTAHTACIKLLIQSSLEQLNSVFLSAVIPLMASIRVVLHVNPAGEDNNLRSLSHNAQNNQSLLSCLHVSPAGLSSDCKARCLRCCWDVKGRKNWRLMGKWDLLNHAAPGCNKQQHSRLMCMWACSTVHRAPVQQKHVHREQYGQY